MKRRIKLIKLTALLLLVLLLNLGINLDAKPLSGEPAGQLVLRTVPMKIKPEAFYIVQVNDQRADKKAIALLVPAATEPGKSMAALPIDLQGGGLSAVAGYLKENLPYRASYRPVLVNIKKLLVTETSLADGRIDGKVKLSLGFDLQTDDELSIHLVNYNGSAHYIRTASQGNVAEPSLRQALDNAMIYFNSWMIQQSDANPVLARSVRLVFTDYQEKENEDTDTIYYAAKRPLTWADFKDHPRNARYDAEVLPGLGYNEQTHIKNGIITVEIAMKAYLPKSAAWVRAGSMNDYNLNHEQRHFDVVKLVSERFKKKLLAQKLPVHNYDGDVNVEYFEALREMDRLQKQYDGETAHGSNMAVQARWNTYIDSELALVSKQ